MLCVVFGPTFLSLVSKKTSLSKGSVLQTNSSILCCYFYRINHLQLTDNQIGTINYIWVVMHTHVLPTELFCSIQSTSKTYDCVKNYLYVSVLGTCHFVYNSLTQIFFMSYCFEIRLRKHNEGLNHLLNLDLRVFTAACLSGWSNMKGMVERQLSITQSSQVLVLSE